MWVTWTGVICRGRIRRRGEFFALRPGVNPAASPKLVSQGGNPISWLNNRWEQRRRNRARRVTVLFRCVFLGSVGPTDGRGVPLAAGAERNDYNMERAATAMFGERRDGTETGQRRADFDAAPLPSPRTKRTRLAPPISCAKHSGTFTSVI